MKYCSRSGFAVQNGSSPSTPTRMRTDEIDFFFADIDWETTDDDLSNTPASQVASPSVQSVGNQSTGVTPTLRKRSGDDVIIQNRRESLACRFNGRIPAWVPEREGVFLDVNDYDDYLPSGALQCLLAIKGFMGEAWIRLYIVLLTI